MSDRDLTDLITKLTKLFVEGRPQTAPPADAGSGSPLARYSKVTEVFELTDDPRVRQKMIADYERAIADARGAIPATATPSKP